MHDGRTDRPDLAAETAPARPVAAPRRVVGLLAAGASEASLISAGADAVEPDPIGLSAERLEPGPIGVSAERFEEPTGVVPGWREAGAGHDGEARPPVVEDAGAAAAALLAGATVLHTHHPRPVRRAADIIALLRAVRG